MASEYCTRLNSRPVTLMIHLRASVFTSYSSPMFTVLLALTALPIKRTLPLSHASLARLRVLNTLMAHRYLSILSFSFVVAIMLMVDADPESGTKLKATGNELDNFCRCRVSSPTALCSIVFAGEEN